MYVYICMDVKRERERERERIRERVREAIQRVASIPIEEKKHSIEENINIL